MNNNQEINNNQQSQLLNDLNGLNNNSQPVNNNRFINVANNVGNNQFVPDEKNDIANPNANDSNPSADNYNETSLSDLNVDGTYNKLNQETPYMQDPQIRENVNNIINKKKTVTINKEMKSFIIIVIILFVFILVMPFIFDLISNIKYS